MDKYSVFSFLAGAVFIVGFVPYIRAILSGIARPMKSTWIVYVVLDTVLLAQIIAADAFNGMVAGAVLGATTIMVLSFKYGVPGWTKVDVAALAVSGIGVAAWLLSGNPVIGMLISACVAISATIPTYISVWSKPENEDRLAWSIYWVSALFGLFAARDWSPAETIAPMSFLLIETTMVLILYMRPRYIKALA